MIDRIRKLMESYSFHFQCEDELQQSIAAMLTENKIAFEREVRITAKDRIDFMVGNIGIECKIDGAFSAVVRQLHRYAQHESIGSIMLITTKAKHLDAPQEINGKQVDVFFISTRRGL